ncbi:photosystem II stability/assembly factor-like uncharacterized protein [Rhodothalassium salexigens DSM 2132]|uniref:Photosystem II stability/assembly factor-like uncharacterized protein n=1 Tax=Rhodothalassium salexigens DSM 2132 TaxID=1188247 RepID=A0A4R2PKC7_RHOSA|nr:hypothetical protein [Rhodothalassium salexigens]MBB4211302.1 photosystem II stability/assembly factor-like uncharacterized protein [Rhodothalassium salexigens DSM 2132]MBK1639374.1 hypothetical protein [Rhodothalassium salexigens DSM 2132]TCP35224.1 photosystem II stability/assembly factor-like uncharacterized protein [Rhodothalassium salexigens DSM 2132]
MTSPTPTPLGPTAAGAPRPDGRRASNLGGRFGRRLARLMGTSAAVALAFSAAGATAAAAELDMSLLDGLKARNVGPAGMSGRITDVAALKSDPNVIYAGAATGGVWRSTNGGLTWEPIFDDQPVHSIGAVAVHPANSDVIWVGTGEGNLRNSVSYGNGVYKSIDGGETWTHVGLENSEHINRIAVHPTDPDIAYVAAQGTLWSDNEQRGVFKTTDGGETWTKVLYVDQETGATDIKMDPSNPNKLFAAMWQFDRKPYEFTSGGPGSGLYVSHDAGETWTRLTPEDGIPEGDLGKAVFAIAPSDPDRVYALVEAEKSALIRSDNGGRDWQTVNADTNVAVRPFYYTELAVDPENPDRVYNVESRVQVSIDGGRHFSYIEPIDCCAPGGDIHIDTHTMWINPADPRHMIVGNDGGLAISRDQGATWRFVENLPLAQFYHVAVDDAQPYNIYGGLQDNGSWRGPSEVWQAGGIRNHHWQEVGFGDGFDTRPFPDNPRAGYTMSQGGNLVRWNLDTGEQRLIKPNPPMGEDGVPVDLRFNWDAGFAQHPTDPDTIFYGSQFVHKSTDRGETWTVISDDLTSNDPDKQTFKTSGGLTKDVTAAENHTTITVIAPSPVDPDVIWVGTDDGRLHVTRDGGGSWTSLESKVRRVVDGAWVAFIDPSPHDADTAFVVFDDHRRGDMDPYVFKADGFGGRFTRIVGSENAAGHALAIRQDRHDPDLMFLGTEMGLYLSLDGGRDWHKWTAGVPTASVMDMAFQAREDDLVIATHGRAVYVIDDIGALRNLDTADFDTRFKLLDTADGQLYDTKPTRESRFAGSGEALFGNEAKGVMLTFLASGDDLPHPDEDKERARLAQKRAEAQARRDQDADDDAETDATPDLTVTVTDADGAMIRTFQADVHQGVNRVVWDMRRDGVAPMPPAKRDDDTLPPGAEVPPGTYKVTLKLGDEAEQSAEVRVLPHPRWDYTEADLAARYEAMLGLQALSARAVAAVERIYDARRDIDTVLTLAADAKAGANDDGEDDPLAALRKDAKALKTRLDELEARFRVPPDTKGIVYDDDKVMSRIGRAGYYLASTYDAPSEPARAAMARAEASLDAALADLNAVLSDDLAKLRTAVDTAGLTLLGQTPVGDDD